MPVKTIWTPGPEDTEDDAKSWLKQRIADRAKDAAVNVGDVVRITDPVLLGQINLASPIAVVTAPAQPGAITHALVMSRGGAEVDVMLSAAQFERVTS